MSFLLRVEERGPCVTAPPNFFYKFVLYRRLTLLRTLLLPAWCTQAGHDHWVLPKTYTCWVSGVLVVLLAPLISWIFVDALEVSGRSSLKPGLYFSNIFDGLLD